VVGKEASTENVLIKVKAKEEEIVGGLIVPLKLNQFGFFVWSLQF